MDDQYSFINIDSLLFQFALQTRELSKKKNEINQQIKVCRADIVEKSSYIETIHKNINKLEEEIRVKQSTLTHNKANAKSMKVTNRLLHQYEQTLKEELESRKANYNHDMEVYEERIANYRKTFQSHKQYYCQSPLAQNLLMLRAEKEEIESRIKACDDEITLKQKELDHLTALSSSSTEELPVSISIQQPIKEPEKQLDPHTGDGDPSTDISSLHLNQTKNGHETSVEANADEIQEANKVQHTTTCSPVPEDASSGLRSYHQLDEQRWQDEMHTEEQEQETEPDGQEQQSIVSDTEAAVEQEILGEMVAVEEEQPLSKEDKRLTAFQQSPSQETNPESSSATVKAVPSTPVFPFNFSPGSSPHPWNADAKSPAFPFSLNCDTSIPGFSGFDVGSAQDEDSSFAFTGSFFNKKKTAESKGSSCPEFLFGQPEQSEDFQFTFTSKSPRTTDKGNSRNDLPFSFNF
uniref:restin homolog isoform X2 n=1 Tax=Scatophagus argus TaxID=75038 RepID=UPI001ED82031|nr:restin homolog isoform X2 [Scatophagus argus]